MRNNLMNERGAAAVEFALIATVLVMLLFGIIEYGKVFSELEVLESAAREGARVASVRGSAAEIEAAVTNAAAGFALDATPTPSMECTADTVGETVTVSWVQTFSVDIPFVTVPTMSRTISGVFRCE